MQLLTVESLYEDDGRRREAEEIRVIILEAQVSSCASDAQATAVPCAAPVVVADRVARSEQRARMLMPRPCRPPQREASRHHTAMGQGTVLAVRIHSNGTRSLC